MSKLGLFLQRWTRLKAQAADTPAPSATVPAAELPPLEGLSHASDFSAFMQPGVDAETRLAALKKLFMTDHYRSMDMLDVYVDDYSKPELLSGELRDRLQHAAALLSVPQASEAAPAATPEPELVPPASETKP